MARQPVPVLGLATSLRWRAEREPTKPALTDETPPDPAGASSPPAFTTWTRELRLVDALPRNASGKVLKADLRRDA